MAWAVILGLIAAMAAIMRWWEGRVWWCEAGDYAIWAGDIWSRHCSQHVFDPYSITHFSHGPIFWWCLSRLRWRFEWKLCIAVALAVGWEILENSPFIIDRYRESTMSLDYLGDSVVNATGDVLSCIIGFYFARAVGWKIALATFILTELVLLVVMRDNLTINVIMLIYPIEALKQWQTAGHLPA